MSMRGDVINVFLPRVRPDRKGRGDTIPDCQDWKDIDSEGAVNELEAIETAVELVDGRQKVKQGCFILTCDAFHGTKCDHVRQTMIYISSFWLEAS